MEKIEGFESAGSGAIGLRYSDLRKSFKFAVRALLTACSKQEFGDAFQNFPVAEQQLLHKLFIQVVTSLHGNIEDEFTSFCLETKVGATLDVVEQLVEEQNLDPLFSDKTNVINVAENLSTAKKNELQHLMHILESAEEQNHLIRARIDHLREAKQDLGDAEDALKKLRSCNVNFGSFSSDGVGGI